MRKFVAAATAILIATVCFSQTASVKGTVTDTAEKKNLPDAVVMLLRKSDSSLIKFTRTNANGEFQISNLQGDTCVILITYPRYADFADAIALKPSQTLDLAKI